MAFTEEYPKEVTEVTIVEASHAKAVKVLATPLPDERSDIEHLEGTSSTRSGHENPCYPISRRNFAADLPVLK
tara:strand:+ start:2469 stop:2687 length:219 start_codon:yes stop_codon:yes gene_type:complete